MQVPIPDPKLPNIVASPVLHLAEQGQAQRWKKLDNDPWSCCQAWTFYTYLWEVADETTLMRYVLLYRVQTV